MKKILAATAIALALAGCNSGPDEASMTKAVEEAVGNFLGGEMQRAMLQGNLTRAAGEVAFAAQIRVGEVKRGNCDEELKKFYCKVSFPLFFRTEKHDLAGEAVFWYDANKRLFADVSSIMNAPAPKS